MLSGVGLLSLNCVVAVLLVAFVSCFLFIQPATHVLLDKVQATIHGHEGCNLLAVLDQLHTSALTDSRVGLLGLNTTAGIQGTTKCKSLIKLLTGA